jgi:hypothetical protein
MNKVFVTIQESDVGFFCITRDRIWLSEFSYAWYTLKITQPYMPYDHRVVLF